MRRTKPAICTLTLFACLGLSVVQPSGSSATTYTFSYSGNNGGFNPNTFVTGSFSIDLADFVGASPPIPFTLSNSLITSLSFTVTYPTGGYSLSLPDLYTTGTTTFSFIGSVPQVSSGAGWLAQSAVDQGVGLTCCAGIVGYLFAGPSYGQVFGTWTTSVVEVDVNPVPLPVALPLFATVLAGGGLIGWRRKRKAARLAAS